MYRIKRSCIRLREVKPVKASYHLLNNLLGLSWTVLLRYVPKSDLCCSCKTYTTYELSWTQRVKFNVADRCFDATATAKPGVERHADQPLLVLLAGLGSGNIVQNVIQHLQDDMNSTVVAKGMISVRSMDRTATTVGPLDILTSFRRSPSPVLLISQ